MSFSRRLAITDEAIALRDAQSSTIMRPHFITAASLGLDGKSSQQ